MTHLDAINPPARRRRMVGIAGSGAVLAATLMVGAGASPAGIRTVPAAPAFTLTAASTSDATGYPAPPPPPVNPEPTNPVNEWFENFKAQDLAFNSSVEHAFGGHLPTDSLPPLTPADALVYDVEAPGNLVRGDVEALIFTAEYLSHGDFGQGFAILAPIPVDTLQGPETMIDTNLTSLAESLGIPQADINAVNSAVYLPMIGLDTSLENMLTGFGASLPNLDPLPEATTAAAAGLADLTDFGGLL